MINVVKREIEGEQYEFYFGTLTFKLLLEETGMKFNDIQESLQQTKSDPISGADFFVNLLWCAYRASNMIQKRPDGISKERIWYWIDLLGVDDVNKILSEGMPANANPPTPILQSN